MIAKALTQPQIKIMIQAGFLPTEVQAFNEAKAVDGTTQDINFNAPQFQDMLKSRRRWVDDLISLGWNKKQIIHQIQMYYYNHRSKRSPFDFLQIEASPSAKQSRMSDTEISRKLLKRTRISRGMGRAYGRQFRPTKVPKNIPLPPRFPNM